MTRDEYIARAGADDERAPGWLAIDDAFSALYPGVTPPHFGAPLPSRAMFGGQEYIDGYSIFPTERGYQHLLTYGMTKLYADESAYGGDYSGWGYELTMKIRANGPEECRWAIDSLGNVARYTYTTERWFEPFQILSGSGRPLRVDSDTLLTSYLIVPDTEVPGIDTVHGRVDFLQFVGISQGELDWVAESREDAENRARELARRIAADGNPSLVTDLERVHSYV